MHACSDSVLCRFDRPYWDSKKGQVDIAKLCHGLIEPNCRKELTLYSVLLVRNLWHSVLASLAAA